MPRDFRERLALILELIQMIDDRLEDIDYAAFETDRNEIDLTAFRLQVIGEQCRHLPDHLKTRHDHIPWRAMYAMRNLISHDYGAILPAPIWEVAKGDLDELAEICRDELTGDPA